MSYYPVSLEGVRNKTARKADGTLHLPLAGFPEGPASSSGFKKLTNPFGETATCFECDIPAVYDFKKDERVLFTGHENLIYSHALYNPSSRTAPALARRLINRYSKPGDIILVPYSGDGALNLEALLSKRHSVGIEKDPFARFLSGVKITPLEGKELDRSSAKLMRSISNYIPVLADEDEIPFIPFRDSWYKKEIALELAYIKSEIDRMWVSGSVSRFYKACFSTILRAVSNYEVNSTGRWARKRSKNVFPTAALTGFAESLLVNTLRIINFSAICPKKIIAEFPEDSTPAQIKYPDGYFSMAISSLPEPAASDFSGLHPPEYYWLGLPGKHGTEKHEHGKYIVKMRTQPRLGKIFGVDITTAYLTYKYLEDARASMEEVYRTLDSGGKYIIHAGKFSIRGSVFESAEHYISIARQVGFKVHTTFISENIKDFMKQPHSRRTPERVIVLEK